MNHCCRCLLSAVVVVLLTPVWPAMSQESVVNPIVGDDQIMVTKGGHDLPLIGAVCNDRLDDVRALLDRGANINEKDRNGWTPLHWASIFGYDSTVKLLIARGAAVDPLDSFYGVTPLHCAAAEAQVSVAAYLINRGARVDARDKKGRTPLHVIVERTRLQDYARGNRLEMIKCLSEGGADMNAVDARGNIPLHYAVARGNIELVRFLVEHRSKTVVRNSDGDTPLMIARKKKLNEIVAYLEQLR